MPTTGGSLALRGIVPPRDAFQVAQLRRAGAVLLGKLNLHELALGLTSVSSLAGQTLNPYDVTRTPGGSSGGSGVAAAACFAAFTLGTDTSGSIRIPSSHNALVGLRPSAGLSSRAGIIPFGHTQDTGGPMARTVEDVALVLDATVGIRPGRPDHSGEQRQDAAHLHHVTEGRHAQERTHRCAHRISSGARLRIRKSLSWSVARSMR